MAALANDGFWGSTTKDFLIDTLFAMLVIGMPLIWTMLMGWVGVKIGRDISGVLNEQTRSSEGAGRSRSALGGRVAGKAMRGGRK
ncbi:MAG TPA: hypothetical protein EYP90_05990 [Chromatiaceae bacterium]|nr:hypothetical protein [Chromatiaceae bacterium]